MIITAGRAGRATLPVRAVDEILGTHTLTIWPQDCRVSRRGKHPATPPSRSSSSAERTSSATVAAATAAS